MEYKKINNLFIYTIFSVLLISCSSHKAEVENYANFLSILKDQNNKSFDCQDSNNANFIKTLANDPLSKQYVLRELEYRMETDPNNITNKTFYEAVTNNCNVVLNTTVSVNGEGQNTPLQADIGPQLNLKPYASLKAEPFESSENNFKVEVVSGSLKVDYDEATNMNHVQLTLNIVHNYETFRSQAMPVILSAILLRDDEDNKAYFSANSDDWQSGELAGEPQHRHVLRWLTPDSPASLSLDFDIERFSDEYSKFYELSLVFYGHKLLLGINNE